MTADRLRLPGERYRPPKRPRRLWIVGVSDFGESLLLRDQKTGQEFAISTMELDAARPAPRTECSERCCAGKRR